jgi:hypothetical protein
VRKHFDKPEEAPEKIELLWNGFIPNLFFSSGEKGIVKSRVPGGQAGSSGEKIRAEKRRYGMSSFEKMTSRSGRAYASIPGVIQINPIFTGITA